MRLNNHELHSKACCRSITVCLLSESSSTGFYFTISSATPLFRLELERTEWPPDCTNLLSFHESTHRYLTTCPLKHTHTHTQPPQPYPQVFVFYPTWPLAPGEVCDVTLRRWGNTLGLVKPCSNCVDHTHQGSVWNMFTKYDLLTTVKRLAWFDVLTLQISLEKKNQGLTSSVIDGGCHPVYKLKSDWFSQ